jgi:preprotein translocase subunit SecG
MSTFSIFLVLITIVCFLLIIVIMVQNPKGGGLSSSIGGSQMLGGVQKTTDFLDKSTWTLASVLILLIMLSSLSFTGTLSDADSKIIDETQTATPAATTPAKPAATTPVQTTPVQTAPVEVTPTQTAPATEKK